MKFNPHNKHLLMLSAVETYYSHINLTPDGSRKSEQVMARNAIACALLRWARSQEEVARVLDRDRSTVAHMMINHEDNLKFWKGYDDLFEQASLIVDNRLSASSKADKLAGIANRIYLLEEEAAILRNELNSIPIPQSK